MQSRFSPILHRAIYAVLVIRYFSWHSEVVCLDQNKTTGSVNPKLNEFDDPAQHRNYFGITFTFFCILVSGLRFITELHPNMRRLHEYLYTAGLHPTHKLSLNIRGVIMPMGCVVFGDEIPEMTLYCNSATLSHTSLSLFRSTSRHTLITLLCWHSGHWVVYTLSIQFTKGRDTYLCSTCWATSM